VLYLELLELGGFLLVRLNMRRVFAVGTIKDVFRTDDGRLTWIRISDSSCEFGQTSEIVVAAGY
jgi:hypothetical protein